MMFKLELELASDSGCREPCLAAVVKLYSFKFQHFVTAASGMLASYQCVPVMIMIQTNAAFSESYYSQHTTYEVVQHFANFRLTATGSASASGPL
jgi:hypothetical protein